MITPGQLVKDVEGLKLPEIASSGLQAVLGLAQEAMSASILLFASGQKADQPDLIGWMSERKLLSDKGLDAPEGESVMAKNYGDHQKEIDAKKKEMDAQGNAVRDQVHATGKLSSTTLQSLDSTIGTLRSELGRIKSRRNDKGELERLTAADESFALRAILEAVSDVHEAIQNAQYSADIQARNIDNSRPYFPGPVGSGPVMPTPSSSNASFTPTGDASIDRILEHAAREVGTVEKGEDNVPGKEYDINAAWCASFATWAWKKAGYQVDWSNKNYVPAIWADAQQLGWDKKIVEAKPGDMIIFDWNGDGRQDHVGIVESVNGNKITTIEGNSSDAVRRNNYTMGQSSLVGVVRPPSSKSESS
ncbi:CHAP domain-containing protein [Nocardia wallacei]|uniref:CHAP domain-containing protein n=1 Tax=Nocardia wallacei TaxID=480035 RepID=UPI002455514A|nr:CHAP domain-containing protein [Nocardia wallacei]